MSQSAPVMGGFYRLKAGSLCQVREIAKAADSGEEMVVYQLLSGNFTTYVCPLREFNFEPASIGEEESAAVPYSRSVSASRELSMQELMISFFDEDNFEKKEDILTEIGQRDLFSLTFFQRRWLRLWMWL